MELLIVVSLVASLVLLDVLAVRFGADSRTNRTQPEI